MPMTPATLLGRLSVLSDELDGHGHAEEASYVRSAVDHIALLRSALRATAEQPVGSHTQDDARRVLEQNIPNDPTWMNREASNEGQAS